MSRPISIIIFGILNFVFAALGVAGVIASVALFSVPANSKDSTIQLLHALPAYTTWLRSCIWLGALGAAAALATGIGLLLLKPWARMLSVIFSVYWIIFLAAAILVNLMLMVQPMFEQAAPGQVRDAAWAIGGPLSGTVGAFLAIVYPITLLAFMLRPKTAAAFRPLIPLQAQPS